MIKGKIALDTNSLLKLDKTKSKILPELSTISLNWKKFEKKKESTIIAEARVKSPEVEIPSSSKYHETLGML